MKPVTDSSCQSLPRDLSPVIRRCGNDTGNSVADIEPVENVITDYSEGSAASGPLRVRFQAGVRKWG